MLSGSRLGIIGWDVARGYRSRCCVCSGCGMCLEYCRVADGTLKFRVRLKRGQPDKPAHAKTASVKGLARMLGPEAKDTSVIFLTRAAVEGDGADASHVLRSVLFLELAHELGGSAGSSSSGGAAGVGAW